MQNQWFPVFKNGLKCVLALKKNDWVINVLSQYKQEQIVRVEPMVYSTVG